MPSLMTQVAQKALACTVPLSVHLDLTYRCNAACIHCYVEQSGEGELSTAELNRLLGELAEAGTLFLSLSGGEVLLREDLLDIVARARALSFNVVVKTNGMLLREWHAERFAALAVAQVHISLYSHRAEVHDAITRLPGSWRKSLEAIRLLRRCGIRTRVSSVLMRDNAEDHSGLQALAADLGCDFVADPTVTPTLSGNTFPMSLRPPLEFLKRIFHDFTVTPDSDSLCPPPGPISVEALNDCPCGAGGSSCYVSPRGDVMPCTQFPVVCGNVRRQPFIEIWRESEELARIRAIRRRDLPLCRECRNLVVCTRCPGLAYMAGDLLGPSLLDCEKAYARTGVPTPLVGGEE